MSEGPGKYYHPGMFPIINTLIERRDLAPGTYDLLDFVPNRDKRDPSLTAKLSNYTTDMRSADYLQRALVFGSESARITGKVEVNPDGSKTFKQIEIRPWDTNFDFQHGPWWKNPGLETGREIARRAYDPENQGLSYDIQYRGPGPEPGAGRIYDPFSDSQLNAALRKEFIYPGSSPTGLLPSITGKPPLPFDEAHRQYLDQASGAQSRSPASNAGAFATRFVSPANGSASGNDMTNWMAGLAGVDPVNPTQPARSQISEIPGISSKPMRRVSGIDSYNPPASVFEPSTPPARFVLPGGLSSSGGLADWIAALAGVDPQNPTKAAPSPQIGGTPANTSGMPVPRQRPVNGNNPPAPVFDPSTPAAPLVPSDNPYSPGGLPGLIAAAAGIDPQNPNQFAPPPLDEGLRGFYRDDPVQPWFVQGRR